MNRIIKFIKKKIFEPREKIIASNTLNPDEIRKIIGSKADHMNNEEAKKYFMENLTTNKKLRGCSGLI